MSMSWIQEKAEIGRIVTKNSYLHVHPFSEKYLPSLLPNPCQEQRQMRKACAAPRVLSGI